MIASDLPTSFRSRWRALLATARVSLVAHTMRLLSLLFIVFIAAASGASICASTDPCVGLRCDTDPCP